MKLMKEHEGGRARAPFTLFHELRVHLLFTLPNQDQGVGGSVFFFA